ncbi:MAG: substrate-binding domain-containing protein, partial [Oscillospiraceae bacterium]
YQEFVVAADARTVAVNANNPITLTDMSSETIRSIFSGEVKYWDEVDATLEHKEIAVYIRDLSGGAYEVFQKAIMGDTEIAANATQCPSMGALGTAIADKLTAMQVDGVAPTEATITDGSYSIQRPLMFVCNHAITAPQQAFIDYAFSQVGIDAITGNGYISVIG